MSNEEVIRKIETKRSFILRIRKTVEIFGVHNEKGRYADFKAQRIYLKAVSVERNI